MIIQKSKVKSQKFRSESGFSILEIILAVAIFVALSTGSIIALISGFNLNRLGAEKTIANQFNSEGMEAVRNIKNRSYTTLTSLAASYCTTGSGVSNTGNVWAFKASGTTDTLTHNATDNYIRTVKVCSVQRDIAANSSNIVASGGISDGNTMKVTVTTTWNFSSTRPESVSLTSYLTNYRKRLGGMLVYGNGSTTTDALQYQTYDSTTDTWSAAASMADVDSGTTNRALRVVRLYASPTRNEKVMVSRHYNGTTQYIYAQVFDGTTWGNVQLLSSWNATTFLDVRNFDGAYLSDGDFMVVYSDNTSIPKYRLWTGSGWGSQLSLVNLANNGSGVPLFTVVRARPGTDEVMAGFVGVASDTNTQYFNGSTWTLHARHATQNPTNTKEMIDFSWHANDSLKGSLIYASGNSDRNTDTKTFTANGSGGGSWSSAASTVNQGTLGAMNLDTRFGATEFLSCDKDASSDILCFEGSASGANPTWTTPTNNTMTATTQTGIQRSYDVAYETTGTQGIVVYSDNTTTPKLKKYNPTTNTFDASATNLTALSGVLNAVRLTPSSSSDDIMFLLFDANRRLTTQAWNGTTNAAYTTGGKGSTVHGTNGSAITEFWGSFAWDAF